jgi:tetratricopeptide (TPR) repeat protein
MPEVERLVGELAREIPDTPASASSAWHIRGPAAVGKTAVLRRLIAPLRERGLAPVLVAPPPRALDAGPWALVEAGVGLRERGLIDGCLEQLTSNRDRWAKKVGELCSWIEAHRDEVVLLCDEPGEWPSLRGEEPGFREHAEEAALLMVVGLPCRRVIAGRLPAGSRPLRARMLAHLGEPISWLRDRGLWGVLAPEAEELALVLRGRISRRSLLEVRLLVALAALGSVEMVRQWWDERLTRRDIACKLAELLGAGVGPGERYLRNAWSRLALVRRDLDDALLGRIVGPAPDERTEALLRRCILYSDEGAFILHWSLRLDAQAQAKRLAGAQPRKVHRDLARYFKDRFALRRSADDPRALLDEMEAFHHAARAGDEELIGDLRPYFAEQLDAWGRSLSHDFRRYVEAAQVFARACRWEPEDDYAHHYLAYNLDVAAQVERTEEIERHYCEAIRLRGDHPWWHSRWLSYLITRGRMSEARRAWSEALDALGLPDPDADRSIYENLHIWVARLLVHRGLLEFAEEVLQAIPSEVLRSHTGLQAIDRRLRALLEVRRSRAVFPLSVPCERWWNGPHLCPRRGRAGPLKRWMPGRIEAVEDGVVHLHLAAPPGSEGEEPAHFATVLSCADFDRWSQDERAGELSAGRFIEMAWYGDDEEPLIRVHSSGDWEDADLPPLFPDPARYLRVAGWVEEP